MASTISAGTTAGTALNFTGDTTGNLAFQTGAGANTISVPNGTGTIAVNGVSTNIVSGTAVASTSGTSIDFTGIPSWVKRITVMFNGVSTNAAGSLVQIQLGAGSIVTTGYTGSGVVLINSPNIGIGSITSGLGIEVGSSSISAATLRYGMAILTLQASNTWVSMATIAHTGTATASSGCGSITLGGTLDRIRITTGNGTDTFDAGSINILYE